MKLDQFLGLIVACAAAVVATQRLAAETRLVRNGSLGQKGAAPTFTQDAVNKLRADGWQCPDREDWPTWWGGLGANMKVEYLREGGKDHDGFLRISGKDGLVTGYCDHPHKAPSYVMSFWAKGHGTLSAGVIAYELSADHRRVVGQAFSPDLAPVLIRVDSEKWVHYRRLLRKGNKELSTHVAFSAPAGSVDLDEVDLEPSNPALDLIVPEALSLYGTGALIERLEWVAADAAFHARVADYRAAWQSFVEREPATEKNLVAALKSEAARLEPYVLRPGSSAVQASHYNDMLALTRVLQRLSGRPPIGAVAVAATEAAVAVDHKPGVRKPRADAVTITDIRSNKVLYAENEVAGTRATLVNRSTREQTGTLRAVMHLDRDDSREVGRAAFAVGLGETKSWSFSYSVGPEAYGRGIEVQFLDGNGKQVDTWQEFYAVAAEWFRVHQHTYAGQNKLYDVNPWVTYYNQRHYFASEPTDFGVQPTPVAAYLSGQAGYQINQAGRKAEIEHFRRLGVKHTFYQTFAFCGQMGYEEMRKHPEYVLYDANGQPAVDPIYGGYPNPLELASPLEVGPPRRVLQPHLDRRYAPWQHCAANHAEDDVIRYQAERVRSYAQAHGFDGIYVDGNMGVLKGYRYDGTPNVPSGKDEDYARRSARNHRLFCAALQKDNANFGIWYNWGCNSLSWARSVGLTSMIGSGLSGDVSDENIRAATAWRNVMILMETGSFLQSKEGPWSRPADALRLLCEQRDFAVQRWGASTIIGYSFIPWKEEEPGPAKWAWPTVNYVGAQLLATQTHYAGGFLPSFRPTLQFMTRYSRLLWAPDIKVVPDDTQAVAVAAPEPLWWKRLVYRRDTPRGHELIVHLVRIPPTERWDYQWIDEPAPLGGVQVTAFLDSEKVQQPVQTLRPYHFEEEQQPIEMRLVARKTKNGVCVAVPPFRYHTMIVFGVNGE